MGYKWQWSGGAQWSVVANLNDATANKTVTVNSGITVGALNTTLGVNANTLNAL